jgi:hypothetical protein
LWQPVTAKWFFVVFGACLAYALVRYHIAEGVAWRHFPLFILNKVVSMAAVFFVAIHLVALGLKGWLTPEKWPAGLVPISLIAFVAAVLPLLVKRRLTKEKEREKKP